MNHTLYLLEEGIRFYDPQEFTALDDEWRRLVGYDNYYRWLWAAIKLFDPKLVVEIGRERGVSATIMLHAMSEDARLYSIDIVKESIFLEGNHDPRLIQITADSLDAFAAVPEGINFLFIDGEHTKERVSAEWELYKQKLAPDAVVVFDDIHFDEGMTEFWDNLGGNKYDISQWHERGFGVLFT